MHSAGPHRAEPPMHRQKDAELDQRIVALRKKNQALLRRYQEIQEDRRQAEQEGMAAPTAALLPPDSLTVTISQVPGERRVVRSWARSPPGRGVDGEDEDAEGRLGGPFCMGDRVDLAVTMENKAEAKRVVSAKPPRARHQGPEGSPPSAPAQAAVSSDAAGKAPRRPAGPPPPQEAGWDYARWKREREQIDRARLARHRDAQGYRAAARPPRRDQPGAAGGVPGPTGSRRPHCPPLAGEVDSLASLPRPQPRAAEPGGRRG